MSEPPGRDVVALAREHLWMPYSPPGAQGSIRDEIRVMTHGAGIRTWDTEGREYLDGTSALEALILGHGDEEVVEAIAAQARSLSFVDVFRFVSPSQAELAAELVAASPGMAMAHFTPGGAEADEVAIKLARQPGCDPGRRRPGWRDGSGRHPISCDRPARRPPPSRPCVAAGDRILAAPGQPSLRATVWVPGAPFPRTTAAPVRHMTGAAPATVGPGRPMAVILPTATLALGQAHPTGVTEAADTVAIRDRWPGGWAP